MNEISVPREVVARRLRNRIIEYLELASVLAQQRDYQANVPYVSVPNEVINQWEDCFVVEDYERYGQRPYTREEGEALVAFHAVWEHVADSTPDPLPDLETTQRLPAWGRLRQAAEQALEVLQGRGKLPED